MRSSSLVMYKTVILLSFLFTLFFFTVILYKPGIIPRLVLPELVPDLLIVLHYEEYSLLSEYGCRLVIMISYSIC